MPSSERSKARGRVHQRAVLTVAEVSDLRRRSMTPASVRVVKNTSPRGQSGTPLEVIANDFKQVTAVAWSDTDPVGRKV